MHPQQDTMESMSMMSQFGGTSWLQCFGTAAVLLIGYKVWYYTAFIRSGIPGPLPLPFYANIKRSREAFYICEEGWIKTYGKVVGFFSVSGPTLLISDVKIVKHMFVKAFSSFRNRGTDQFIQSGRLRKMLTLLKDDHWKTVRTTISPAFTASKMKLMAGTLNECAEGILLQRLRQSAKEAQTVEVKKLYGSYSIGCIGIAGFGLKLDTKADDDFTLSAFENNAKEFFSRVKSSKWLMVGILQNFLPTFVLEYFDIGLVSQASERFFFDMSAAIIKKREQGDLQSNFVDFMQLMVNAHELEGEDEEQSGQRSSSATTNKKVKLSMDEVSQCVMFLLAGYETTSACLVFTSYLLASHPDIQEKLAAEVTEVMHGANSDKVTSDLISKMPYLEMVVTESLRVYPPITRASRTCTEDATVRGLHVKKGTRIITPIWAIHHNPDLWPEPLTFNPDRFSPENKESVDMDALLSFGYGPRSCLGTRFALMEIKIALIKILREFRIEMVEDTPKMLELGKGVFLAPRHPVPLQFVHRA